MRKKNWILRLMTGVILVALTACNINGPEKVLHLTLLSEGEISSLQHKSFPRTVEFNYSLNEKYYDYAKNKQFVIYLTYVGCSKKARYYVLKEAATSNRENKSSCSKFVDGALLDTDKANENFKGLVKFDSLSGSVSLEVDSYVELKDMVYQLQWDYMAWSSLPPYSEEQHEGNP